jgi:hypothetical protein
MTNTNRRPLIAGIAQSLPGVDPESAATFITGESPKPPEPVSPRAGRDARVPLTTRLRADVGEALKRASLERQLRGEAPWQVQEMLDEALTPWLRQHGYLP